MIVADILRQSALTNLDTEVLLAHAVNRNREWVITHTEYELTDVQLQSWVRYEQRRQSFEPVAYITGQKEFYGREFMVNKHVLIPRPATEGLIDSVKRFMQDGADSVTETDTQIVAGCKKLKDKPMATQVLDLGTGSGCIAITLKLELPMLEVVASDIASDALNVAEENAATHNADILCIEADGAAALQHMTKPFVLVSNPPYIPTGDVLETTVTNFEPHQALFSGSEGTDLLQKITTAAVLHPLCVGICLECRAEQWKLVEKLA